LIGILLFSWPTIGLFIKPQQGEEFSELYILGPNHTFSGVPFNIKPGVTYSVYLGIGNHMASSSYYTSVVKFRNEHEPLPNTALGIPSPLSSLYEYRCFIQDGENWEKPLTILIRTAIITNGVSYLPSITINGLDYSIEKYSEWNSNRTGYYYGLFVELWIFNSTSGSQFNNRFVNLVLNMTE
jgi:hypothetical protein